MKNVIFNSQISKKSAFSSPIVVSISKLYEIALKSVHFGCVVSFSESADDMYLCIIAVEVLLWYFSRKSETMDRRLSTVFVAFNDDNICLIASTVHVVRLFWNETDKFAVFALSTSAFLCSNL